MELQQRQLQLEQATERVLKEASSLSEDENGAFLQALRDAPHLISLESDPQKFLMREQFDVNAAAKRLAGYWRHRQRLFGERAFLPMTITGDGALTREDVSGFLQGNQILLPNNADNRPVLFSDRANFIHNLDEDMRIRIVFYNMHLLLEREESLTMGFITLSRMDGLVFTNTARELTKLLSEALPIELYSNHMFLSVDEASLNFMFAQYASQMVSLIGVGPAARNSRLHPASTVKERKEKALACGFLEEGLPEIMGGTYGPDKFAAWFQERVVLEIKRYSRFVPSGTLLSHDVNPTPIQPGVALGAEVFGNAAVNVNSFRHTDDNHQYFGPAVSLSLAQHQQREDNFQNMAMAQLLLNSTAFSQARGSSPIVSSDFLQQAIAAQQALATLAQGQAFMNSQDGPYSSISYGTTLPTAVDVSQANAFSPSSGNVASAGGQCAVSRPALTTVEESTVEVSTEDAYAKEGIEPCIVVNETDAVMKSSNESFEQAIGVIPEEEKAAYLEALSKAPEIVAKETDPHTFMRVANFDSWAAARRLVEYWSIRKKLFEDRAFLPMIQTTHGALSRDDVVSLSCGAIALVPNDRAGRGVIVSDRTRTLDQGEKTARAQLRSLFYLLQVLSDDKINQTDGIVIIVPVILPRVVELGKNVIDDRSRILNVAPVKLKALHMLVCPPKAGKRSLIDHIVTTTTKAFRFNIGKRVVIHTSSTAEQIREKLKKFGIVEANLPTHLGGTWKYEQFTHWQRQRSQTERALHRFTESQCPVAPGEPEESGPLSAEKKKARKRKLNVIHSRQKRERRRSEMDDLKRNCKELEEKNLALRNENRILEQVLDDAKIKLACIEEGIGNQARLALGGSSNSLFDPTNVSSNIQQLLSAQMILDGSDRKPAADSVALDDFSVPPIAGHTTVTGHATNQLIDSMYGSVAALNTFHHQQQQQFSSLSLQGSSGDRGNRAMRDSFFS